MKLLAHILNLIYKNTLRKSRKGVIIIVLSFFVLLFPSSISFIVSEYNSGVDLAPGGVSSHTDNYDNGGNYYYDNDDKHHHYDGSYCYC